MMSSILGNIQIADIPTKEARKFKAVGVIGDIDTREINGGYLQVAVPLSYRLTTSDTEDRHFIARFNLRQEWLTPEFTAKVRKGEIDGSELIQYNINVKGLLKGLFTSAGVANGGLDLSMLSGKMVGFATKPQRNNPERLELSYFFAPKV